VIWRLNDRQAIFITTIQPTKHNDEQELVIQTANKSGASAADNHATDQHPD
jgi:hypothetical protein